MIEKKISLEGVPHPSHADAINRVRRDHPEAADIVLDWNAKEARFTVPQPTTDEAALRAELERIAAEAVEAELRRAAEDGGYTPSASGAELIE